MTLSDEVKRLLDGPNFAHLATLMQDGSPVTPRRALPDRGPV